MSDPNNSGLAFVEAAINSFEANKRKAVRSSSTGRIGASRGGHIRSRITDTQYMNHAALIDDYFAGAQQLRNAISGMTDEQIDVAPIPGKWSTRQVICHIADFEPVYADRMKRALAEDEPTIFGGDPDAFAARLAYDQRDIEEELQMIESVRKHMARILRTLTGDDFQRKVNHSEDGPLTVEQLLTHITNHIPHHIPFIKEKRAAL